MENYIGVPHLSWLRMSELFLYIYIYIHETPLSSVKIWKNGGKAAPKEAKRNILLMLRKHNAFRWLFKDNVYILICNNTGYE